MKKKLFRYSEKEKIIRRNWNWKTFTKEIVDRPYHPILNFEKRRITYIASNFLEGYMNN